MSLVWGGIIEISGGKAIKHHSNSGCVPSSEEFSVWQMSRGNPELMGFNFINCFHKCSKMSLMSFHLLWIHGNISAWNRRSSWLELCLWRERDFLALGLNHKTPTAPGDAKNAAEMPCPAQHTPNSASALLGDHWHFSRRIPESQNSLEKAL